MSPTTVVDIDVAWRRCDAASTTWATRALPNRPKPRRKSSGVPSTTTRSARCFSSRTGAQEGQLVIGGQRAAAEAVEEARHAQLLDGGAQLLPRSIPVDVAADDERRSLGGGDHRGELGDGLGVGGRTAADVVVDTRHARRTTGRTHRAGSRGTSVHDAASSPDCAAAWTVAAAWVASFTVTADLVIDATTGT